MDRTSSSRRTVGHLRLLTTPIAIWTMALALSLLTLIPSGRPAHADEPVRRPIAQSTEPTATETHWPQIAPESLPENRRQSEPVIPLVRPDRSSKTGAEPDQSQKDSSKNRGLWGNFAALGFVLVLILGVSKLFSRKNPFAVASLPLSAIEVLGRRTVDPRNSIYVVKVGGKALVVASSANGLTPLSEITDPIEVAALINACHAVEPGRESWLDRLRELAGSKPEAEPPSFTQHLQRNTQAEEIVSTRPPVGLSGGRITEGRHAR